MASGWPLSRHGSGVGSEQQREVTPIPPLVGWPLNPDHIKGL